jgi:cysteine-rich repeat protein
MRAAVLLLLATGCSKILGIGDVQRGDGGTSDGTSVDAPPNTVVGREVTRCGTATGTTDVPFDLSQAVVAAMFVDATQPTGFRTVTGSGSADGTFTIHDVPDGMEYYLKIDRSYFVTTQHVIDLHYDEPVRCTPPPATSSSPTTLTLDIQNLTPWRDDGGEITYDELHVLSYSLLMDGFGDPVTNDTTHLMAAFDWNTSFSLLGGAPKLPDASAGDDIHVAHLRNRYVLGTTKRKHLVTTTLDFAEGTATLTNGGSASLAATATQIPQTSSATLTVSRGQFDSGFDATTKFSGLSISTFAYPIMSDFGYVLGAPILSAEFSDWSRSTTLTESVPVSFGDAFPATWTRYQEVAYLRSRYFRLPGTTTPRSNTGELYRLQTYSGGAPIASPLLQPPANIKISGKDQMPHDGASGGLIPFDGKKPITVSWNPVANARMYLVQIYRIVANGSGSTRVGAGGVYTTASTVEIPAEVINGGEYFVFNVFAYQTPADYAAGQLTPNGAPSAIAITPSGLFRVNETCGNGTVDSNEACDGMGETATCDVDCTAVMCGDGLRNAKANEACDTALDTESCDSDCTLPVCGDGHRNPLLEDCDDGNTTNDGNGCGSNCKFNNFCGNSVVESLAEECDTGGTNTATCDSDCTLAACGDGLLNVAHGETCDYGAYNGTGNCDANCHLITP